MIIINIGHVTSFIVNQRNTNSCTEIVWYLSLYDYRLEQYSKVHN